MTVNMVDSNKWFVESIGECLGITYTYQQTPYKTCSISNRYCVNIIKSKICFGNSFFDNIVNCINVISACNFWHNSTKQCMNINLTRNNARKNSSAVFHNGTTCFIATRFYRKYFIIFLQFHNLYFIAKTVKKQQKNIFLFKIVYLTIVANKKHIKWS